MNKYKLAILIAVFAIWAAVAGREAHAAVSPHINFTGKILQADGEPLADGNYDMTFRLFSVPAGGAAIWSEDRIASTSFSGVVTSATVNADTITIDYNSASATTTLRVGQHLTDAAGGEAALITDFDTVAGTITVAGTTTSYTVGGGINNRPRVEGGVINEDLGAYTDLSSLSFDGQLYLEVVFNGDTMRPRKFITSSAQALNADRLGGYSASSYANTANNTSVTGLWSFLNALTVSTSSDSSALTVTQSGGGRIVDFIRGTSTALTILNNGNVGIGTSSPLYTLDVYGSGRFTSGLRIGNYSLPSSDGAPGYVLKTNGAGTVSWMPDLVGVAGGQAGAWASSTDNLLIYPADTNWTVVVGSNATTSPGYKLEVVGDILVQDITASTISLSAPLSVVSGGTGSSSPYGLLYGDGAGNIISVANNSANWNTAYGWGNHASANYFDKDVDLLTVSLGGTGRSSWATSSLVYASAWNTLGQIAPGANGQILSMVGGVPAWSSTASATPHGILSTTHSDVSGTTTIVRGDLITGQLIGASTTWSRLALGPSGYLLRSDGTDAAWAPTTDITALGTIATGTWQGGVIGALYGGTGLSSYATGSLLYAPSGNTLNQLVVGPNGRILQVVNGLPQWVATSSLGIDFNAIDGTLAIEQGGTGASTTEQARANFGLTDAYNLTPFFINATGTAGQLWASTGLGRGEWRATSTLGLEPAISILPLTKGGLGFSSIVNQSLVYASAENTLGALAAGLNGQVLSVQNGALAWTASSSAAMHSILSVQHSDTAPATIQRGDLLVVDSTTRWSRLALGASGSFITSNGTDASWSAGPLSVAYGGTGWNSTGSSGIAYLTSGSWGASSTLGVSAGGTGATTAASARSSLGLVIGTNVQSYSSILSDIASLPTTSGLFMVANGATWTTQDASNVRTTLSLRPGVDIQAYDSDIADIAALSHNGQPLFMVSNGTNWSSQGTSTARATLGLDNVYANSGYMIDSAGANGSLWRSQGAGRGAWIATSSLGINLADTTGTLTVARGGTGTTTLAANGIVYAPSANTFGQILPGSEGYVLKMLGGVPQWSFDATVGGESQFWATSSNSLLIYPTNVNHIVVIGRNSTTSTDVILEVAGNALFSGSINAQSLSLVNALSVASGGTGSTSPSGLLYGDGAGNIVSVANNSVNWNTAYSWGDHSIQNYFDKDVDILTVALGGTGRSDYTANSILFASATNTIGQIPPGNNGYALVMENGTPTWSSTTPGVAHGMLSALHSDTDTATTAAQGDLIVRNASVWTKLALGPSGYILRSNGSDPVWATTTLITALGNITAGTWQSTPIGAAYGGTGTSSQSWTGIAFVTGGEWGATSVLSIENGGTGAGTAPGARANLGLTDIFEYGVNSTGTVGWLWQADGSGRGHWVATTALGIQSGGTVGVFIGTTSLQVQGNFATSTLSGYAAGNARCSAQFAGSFMCRTHDLLVTIEKGIPASWAGGGNAWIAEGPPGYTSNSNDCNGYTSNSNGRLGAFWEFDDAGGGMGWLVNCAEYKPVACCAWISND